jgi:hypothetical protein
MSLHVVALGSLTADPVQRTSASGNSFATATIRVATEDGAILASVIAAIEAEHGALDRAEAA